MENLAVNGLSGENPIQVVFQSVAGQIVVPDVNGNIDGLALQSGQIPIGVTGGPPVAGLIQGTANQIGVTNAAGAVTLFTPQPIDTKCDFVCNSVTGKLVPTGLTGQRLVATDSTGALTTGVITTGNGAQVTVDASGNPTFTLQQDLRTTAGPGFAQLTLTGVMTSQWIEPVTDANYDLGTGANRFRDGWFSRDVESGQYVANNTSNQYSMNTPTGHYVTINAASANQPRIITIPTDQHAIYNDTFALLAQDQTFTGSNSFSANTHFTAGAAVTGGITTDALAASGTLSAGATTLASAHCSGTSALDGAVTCGSSLSAQATTAASLHATGTCALDGAVTCSSSISAASAKITGLVGPAFVGVDASGNLGVVDTGVEGAVVSASATGALQATTLASANANGITSTLSFAGSTLTLNNNASQNLDTTGTPSFVGVNAGTSGVTSTGQVATAITTGGSVSHVALTFGPVNNQDSAIRLGTDDTKSVHPAFIWVTNQTSGTQNVSIASKASASPWTSTAADVTISQSAFTTNVPIVAGTNPISSVGAITSSGTFSNGTNAMTTGAITSSGAFSCGTNAATCGAITPSGLAHFTNTTDSGGGTGSVVLDGGMYMAKSLRIASTATNAILMSGAGGISCGPINSATIQIAGAGNGLNFVNNNAQMSHYYENTYSGFINGCYAGGTVVGTLKITRVGKSVTGNIFSNNTTTGSTNTMQFSITLDSQYWPASVVQGVCLVVNNNTSVYGLYQITATGGLTFYVAPSFSNFTAATLCGLPNTTISWQCI